MNDPFARIVSIIEAALLEPNFWPLVLEALSEAKQKRTTAEGTIAAIHILQTIFPETISRLSQMGSSSFLECLATPTQLARDNPVYLPYPRLGNYY